MKPRHLAMAAALAVSGWLVLFGDKSSNSQLAEPVVREHAPKAGAALPAASPSRSSAPAPSADAEHAVASAAPVILRLKPRTALLGEGDDARIGGKDSVFLSQNWNPPPPPPAPAPPPPPPSAPPLPFVYVGKAVGEGAWEVFLARGERTYIVRNQSIIDGQYRVESIAPPMMTLTYLPLKQVQQLNIGVLD